MVTIDYLYQVSNRKISMVSLDYKRPVYYKINWDNRLMASVDRKGAGRVLRLILKKCGDLGHGESLQLPYMGQIPNIFSSFFASIVSF